MMLKLALRNVFRNVRRSSLTALTVGFGCFFLIIGLSWLKGIQNSLFEAAIASSGSIRLSTEAYSKKDRLFPIEENMPLTKPIVEDLERRPFVTSAHEIIRQPVAASQNNSDIGEIFTLLVGAKRDYYSKHLKLEAYLSQGAAFSKNESFEHEVILGAKLAEQMNITIGQDALFMGQTQDGSISPIKLETIGIINSSNPLLDRQAYISLSQARWMADIPQGATEILIYTKDSAEQVANDLETHTQYWSEASQALDKDGKPALLKAQAWSQREPIRSLLPISNAIHLILSGFIVFVTALGILNTMMMNIFERTQEIGVLRAMGLLKRHIAGLFLQEASIIGLIGGVAGTALGSCVALWLQLHGVHLGTALSKAPDTISIQDTIYAQWSPYLVFISLFWALLMSALGALWPIIKAIQITPAEAMRSK